MANQAINREEVARKIAAAKGTQGGNYFRDGNYLAVVIGLELAGGHKGARFVGEFRVLEAVSVDIPHDMARKNEDISKVKPNAVGSIVSKVCMLGQEMGPSNAKMMLCGIDGTPAGEVDETTDDFVNMTLAATEKAQPLRGTLVRIETYRKRKAKNQDEVMVLERWVYVDGQTEATILAMRAKLDAGAPISDMQALAATTDDIPF